MKVRDLRILVGHSTLWPNKAGGLRLGLGLDATMNCEILRNISLLGIKACKFEPYLTLPVLVPTLGVLAGRMKYERRVT